MAAWALSLYKNKGRAHMLTLYKSVVRSHLEFSCPLWNPYRITDIAALEGVQRTFTSKIHGFQHFNYWERLSKLNLQSLQRRRERYILIYVWKILQGKVPNDINMQFSFNERRGFQVTIKPMINAYSKGQTIYDNSFIITGAKLWNLLPLQVNAISSSLNVFKSALSKFMNLFPDNPPVAGYQRMNNNSLLEWWPFLNATTDISRKIKKLFC